MPVDVRSLSLALLALLAVIGSVFALRGRSASTIDKGWVCRWRRP